jgi:uncharacterized delta-60 repeat protein
MAQGGSMRRSLLTLALALALLATAAAVALATPGELDTTFDTDGIRTLDVTPADFGRDVLVQPDGRIVLAGSSGSEGLVGRVRADGEPDTDFNDLGHKVLPGAGASQGVARAPNGDLIVAGTLLAGAAYNITVMRLRPNGTPDPGFGTAGLKTVDFGGSETATDVLVQPDGKIVVSGYTDTDELVVRLNANGDPDTGFDVDGKVTLEYGAAAYGNAVALAPDGRIVVGGYVSDADDPDLTVARVLANGTPDPSFDDDGLKRIDPGTLDYGRDVLVQPDGKVLVTGASDSQFVAVRLAGNGVPDQSFDGDGVAKADAGGAATSLGAVLQANGKIVLAGQAVGGTGPQQAVVVRLQPGGTLDTTFSFDGVQRINLPSSGAEAVALQTDGRVVLAGTTTAAGNVDAWVARLEGDPPEIGGGPAPGQSSSPTGGGPGGGGSGGGRPITQVPRCAGKRATIVGSPRADRLKGTRRADVIVALGGNDRIAAGSGNDLICAGNGNDRIDGGTGNDRLYGQNGNDKLGGASGKDSLSGGGGKDQLSGGGGRDKCTGGAGKDRAACERRRSL